MKNRVVRGATMILAATLMLASVGCEVTPEKLDRWANREGSEEMFIEYLEDPETSYEVKVRAVELLVDQWRYSGPMIRNGALDDVPEDTLSSAVDGAMAHFETTFESGERVDQVRVRDAIFYLRPLVTDQEVRQQLDDMIIGWLRNDWASNPCVEVGGVTSGQMLNRLGQEQGEPILNEVLSEGGYEPLMCALNNTENVEWRSESEVLGTTLINRWDSWAEDDLPDATQPRISFLDQLSNFAELEPVRVWLFEKFLDQEINPVYRNYMADLIADTRVEADRERYLPMLNNNDTYRWVAVEALTEMAPANAEGLLLALNNLPSVPENPEEADTVDYAFWNGSRQADGLRSAANAICNLEAVTGQADNVRGPLMENINIENPYARAVLIRCLGTTGNAETIEALTAYKEGLDNTTNLEIPYWSGDVPTLGRTMMETIIDESITMIQERAAAAAAEENANEEGEAAAE